MNNARINQLLTQIVPIYVKANQMREEKRKRGECFNVFNTIGLWSEEVRLHSAFLAELLNPKGSHGMGDAYLKHFFLMLGENEDFVTSTKVNPDIVERSIGCKTDEEGGRIDIIIEDGTNAIIIENKIYAGDQENQLLRYDNYGRKFQGIYRLLYLTLYGNVPSEESTGGKLGEDAYICISYERHIINWLYECVKLSYDKPLVRETIKQYIHLLKQLTKQDMEIEDKKAIAELAVENIDATAALMDARPEISRLIRERFIFSPLKEYADKHDLTCQIDGNAKIPNIKLSKDVWNGCICISSDKNYCWKEMFIGITSDNPQQLEAQKLDCLAEAPTKNWPYGWQWSVCKDWHSSSNYKTLKNNVAMSLIAKIEEIIKEIEEKSIFI